MRKKWSKEEDSFLINHYYSSPKEFLINKLNRSWKAIRCRANKLKLKRDEKLIKEENIIETKKALIEKYGTDNIFSIPEIKEKIKLTNLKKRGVPYPTQDTKVKEKIKNTIIKKYNVDHIFKSEQIKEKIKQTFIKKYNSENPLKNQEIREKIKNTLKKKYNVTNPFQLTEKIKNQLLSKYGYTHPLKVPDIKKKKELTCLQKYGAPYPTQNNTIQQKLREAHSSSLIKEKKYISCLKNNKLNKSSKEELEFLKYLTQIDPNIIIQPLHPVLKHNIDFYSPLYDLWIQYDGNYWHGKLKKNPNTIQYKSIQKVIKKDEKENKFIPNLIRFQSDEVIKAKKNNNIIELIKNKIKEKTSNITTLTCFQYLKKIEHFKEDISNLPTNYLTLKAFDFSLNKEPLSQEIIDFIKKYEWLGTIGNTPKWCFTARYNNILGGVILINEPNTYSKILGEVTPKYEALIQRGATASWTPKNLGSRLLMFSCRWMVNNTEKRAFVGYADPAAGEKGIIYQACNFEYIGDKYGSSFMYQHPEIEKPFTEHDLKRTSSFKKWCKINNIKIEKDWIKPNGIKDIKKIPLEIKKDWYNWIKKTISESIKIKNLKKRKYVLVLAKNKNEKKFLDSIKTYRSLPYPKEPNISSNSDTLPNPTLNRRTEGKINFIIENYPKMSIEEIAHCLKENKRWVKRLLNDLIKENKIKCNNTNP